MPGPTETEFWATAGNDRVLTNRRTTRHVVDSTMEALRRDHPIVVDGTKNRVLTWAARLAPVKVQTAVSHYITTR